MLWDLTCCNISFCNVLWKTRQLKPKVPCNRKLTGEPRVPLAPFSPVSPDWPMSPREPISPARPRGPLSPWKDPDFSIKKSECIWLNYPSGRKQNHDRLFDINFSLNADDAAKTFKNMLTFFPFRPLFPGGPSFPSSPFKKSSYCDIYTIYCTLKFTDVCDFQRISHVYIEIGQSTAASHLQLSVNPWRSDLSWSKAPAW